MRSGFATLIGIVIAIAILAFVMIKVMSSTLQSKQNIDQSSLNPTKVQNQVNDLQNQLEQKQNQDLNTQVKWPVTQKPTRQKARP